MNIGVLTEWCVRNGHSFKKYGGNPQVLLVGEAHGCIPHQDRQKELIQLIDPEVIVHELWEQESKGKALTTGDLAATKLYDWELEYGLEIVAGDASQEQQQFLTESLEKLLGDGRSGWPAELSVKEYSSLYSRLIAEGGMGMRIRAQVDLGKNPVLAIYGSEHVKPHSHIHKVLQGKARSPVLPPIEYAVIQLERM